MTLGNMFNKFQSVRKTRSGFQTIVIDNYRHIICFVNFNIKRRWRFLSNFDVGHCPVLSNKW